jgi:hypothetical protein
MKCDWLSLLMKSTRVPGGTVIAAGLAPLEVSVMVVLLVGVPPELSGALGDDPPQFSANEINAPIPTSRPRVIHVANVRSLSMLDRMLSETGPFRLRKSLRNK